MDAKTRPWRSGLSILSAVLLILCHPPWSLGWLAPIALVPLLVALSGTGLRRRLLLAWLCGTVWSSGMVGFWLAPATAGALGVGTAASVAIALAACQLFGGLHMVAFATLAGGRPGWGGPLAVAIAWVASETLRSAAFAAIPWGLLGHALWERPLLIQAASLAGVAAVSFWLAAINGAITLAVLRRRAGGSATPSVALAVSVAAVVAAHGAWRTGFDGAGADRAGFAIEIVHSDWPRLDRDGSAELLRRTIELTSAAPGAAALTVWPEAAMRALPTAAPEQARSVFALAERLDRPLIFGAPRTAAGALYNALYSLRPGARDFVSTYDKRRLVPLAESHFARGESDSVFVLAPGVRVAPLLCFEALFPDLAVGREADVLLNPTNDVRVGAGAGQQAAMAVFRAVENGIPLVRVANRGPSMLVDGYGRILERASGWGGATWQLPAPLDSTPYRRSVAALETVLPRRFAAEGPLGLVCLFVGVVVALRRTVGGEPTFAPSPNNNS